jgi:hypothetical protein
MTRTDSYRKVEAVRHGEVTYRPGDGVSVKAGRFVRYGSITELFEAESGHWARVRFGHGTEMVSFSRVRPL